MPVAYPPSHFETKIECFSLPIGYWSVPTNASVAPYVPGAWPYIQRAVGWARQHNVHTIVDLHGAPGSQNGFDNSGQHTGTPQWALNPANVEATLAVIKVIATELGPQVDAIELMNEIAGFMGPVWDNMARTYYQSGYNVVRQAAGNNILVVLGDAFDALTVRGCYYIALVVALSIDSFAGVELEGFLDLPTGFQSDDGRRTSGIFCLARPF
jgi:aryl-phospho-beta-D-glucosidase BglC (GH1 family)